MRKALILAVALLSTFCSFSQNDLPTVDTNRLKKLINESVRLEPHYLHLSDNFDHTRVSEKEYDWGQVGEICAFVEKFEFVQYSVESCKEAGGTTQDISFTGVSEISIRNWIEAIYEVTKTDEDDNIWKENSSKFEPRETVPGCYYELTRSEEWIKLRIYCGC